MMPKAMQISLPAPMLLVAVALLSLLPADYAGAAILRSAPVVSGPLITLGDIFEDAGGGAATVVAAAPLPGSSRMLSASTIAAAARKAGLSLDRFRANTRVVVKRRGQLVPVNEIRASLNSALRAKGIRGDHRIRLSNSRIAIYVPLTRNASVSVLSTDYDPANGRFEAIIGIPTDTTTPRRLRLTGRAIAVSRIPVLAQAVDSGEIIDRDNIVWRQVPSGRVGHGVIRAEKLLAGFETSRPLRAGVPLRKNDIRKPVLMARGNIVTMVVLNRGMTLTATARALEDGALGDTIRVMNMGTHQTVYITITSASEGRVTLPSRHLAANNSR